MRSQATRAHARRHREISATHAARLSCEWLQSAAARLSALQSASRKTRGGSCCCCCCQSFQPLPRYHHGSFSLSLSLPLPPRPNFSLSSGFRPLPLLPQQPTVSISIFFSYYSSSYYHLHFHILSARCFGNKALFASFCVCFDPLPTRKTFAKSHDIFSKANTRPSRSDIRRVSSDLSFFFYRLFSYAQTLSLSVSLCPSYNFIPRKYFSRRFLFKTTSSMSSNSNFFSRNRPPCLPLGWETQPTVACPWAPSPRSPPRPPPHGAADESALVSAAR